ncbi:spore coat protein X [Geobacillus subterraneus]|uniref:Spore coat protein X n=2 Tax=Anoxybacillaceae TaxID=3120669 RepID=A0A679FPY3_9BACL|nr:hypothetical protein B4113_2424 [Geobacillus sp. B4113_201601]BBW97059.1 spore coat protein X [Geobacillus subterraneus]
MSQVMYNRAYPLMETAAHEPRRWCATDPTMTHPVFNCEDATIGADAEQKAAEYQLSEEWIYIKDSCEVKVSTTDTKAAVNLQVALQLAIIVLLQISIADSEVAEEVAAELLQAVKVKQVSRQKTVIENSRNVTVETTDTQAAINIQIMLQLLLALLVFVDIL